MTDEQPADPTQLLLTLALREFQQCKMAMDNAAALLDLAIGQLPADQAEAVGRAGADAIRDHAVGAKKAADRKPGTCPRDKCRETTVTVNTFAGKTLLCPDHGEVASVDA